MSDEPTTEPTDTTDQEPTPEADGRYPAEVVEKLRQEAADRRTKARDADTAREAAEKRAEALSERLLHVSIKEHAATLADPLDLLTFAQAADLLDDNGEPDAEKIKTATTELLAKKPHLSARRAPAGDIDQGPRGTEQPEPFDFASALRKAAG